MKHSLVPYHTSSALIVIGITQLHSIAPYKKKRNNYQLIARIFKKKKKKERANEASERNITHNFIHSTHYDPMYSYCDFTVITDIFVDLKYNNQNSI